MKHFSQLDVTYYCRISRCCNNNIKRSSTFGTSLEGLSNSNNNNNYNDGFSLVEKGNNNIIGESNSNLSNKLSNSFTFNQIGNKIGNFFTSLGSSSVLYHNEGMYVWMDV